MMAKAMVVNCEGKLTSFAISRLGTSFNTLETLEEPRRELSWGQSLHFQTPAAPFPSCPTQKL